MGVRLTSDEFIKSWENGQEENHRAGSALIRGREGPIPLIQPDPVSHSVRPREDIRVAIWKTVQILLNRWRVHSSMTGRIR